ncbi:MAG TPA: ornithine cyclodeaminase [Candidatus Bathyarchaeia archaeon]|nr:ornithine cyclodeaminase [Candidatus Bathyarchaeia archaeon]
MSTQKDQAIEFLYLSQEEVKAAGGADMKMVVEAVESVFRAHAEGKVITPPKTVLDLDEKNRGRINSMPSYVGGDLDVCGIKWIASFPKNPQKYGIPRAMGIIILTDSWKGVPLAIMDGTLISAMRTGAVTGVGAKYMARKDAETVAMIGCGVQARTQLMALKSVLPSLKNVKGFDLNMATAERYAKDMAIQLGMNAKAVGSAKDAVTGADVIVTVTVADEPIVKNDWVKQGSFFSHVGSYQEEEYDVVSHSDKLFVDDWEQVEHRGTSVLAKMHKEGLLKKEDITGSLGDVVTGKVKGRDNDRQRVFFEPIGMGSEDVAVAYKVYKRAVEKKMGQRLNLWTKPELS